MLKGIKQWLIAQKGTALVAAVVAVVVTCLTGQLPGVAACLASKLPAVLVEPKLSGLSLSSPEQVGWLDQI